MYLSSFYYKIWTDNNQLEPRWKTMWRINYVYFNLFFINTVPGWSARGGVAVMKRVDGWGLRGYWHHDRVTGRGGCPELEVVGKPVPRDWLSSLLWNRFPAVEPVLSSRPFLSSLLRRKINWYIQFLLYVFVPLPIFFVLVFSEGLCPYFLSLFSGKLQGCSRDQGIILYAWSLAAG